MDQKELSMQVNSREEWEVTIGRERFSLNKKQIEVLKEATTKGSRGIVWFKDFGISIPHIQSVSLKRRDYSKLIDGIAHKIGKEEYLRLSKSLVKKGA